MKKKKMFWVSTALLCTTLMTPAAQAASVSQTASVPAHFDTAWEQLLEQFGIKKPTGGTVQKPDSGNNNGTTSKPEQGGQGSTPDSGSGSTGSTGGSTGNTGSATAAQEVLRLVNAARAQNGLSALTLDASMSRAANVRASELAKSFSHTRPNGTRGLTALAEAGVSYRAAGENIAAGQQTAQAVMSGWMNSSGHRANILSSKYSRLGVGQVVINGRTYWVQFFAD